jgi:hypothetical protein
MKVIFSFILFLVAIKCIRATYIEMRDGTSWWLMWGIFALLAIFGAIALL